MDSPRFLSRRQCISLLLVVGALLLPLTVQAKPKKGTLPKPEELNALTEKTMLDVDKALETGDFNALYATLSPSWQKQTTVEKLTAGFQGLVANKIRLDKVKGMTPVFEPAPVLEPSGVLMTQGYYATAPYRIRFTARYYNDAGPWKPLGLLINPQEVDKTTNTVKLPPVSECTNIAATTLLQLDAGLEKKDFSDYRGDAAPDYQRTATVERLNAAFAKLITDGVRIDKSATDGSPNVTFAQPPALNPGGDMTLTGTASAQPAPVNFTFVYRLEGGTWKLISGVVNGLGGDLDKAAPAPTTSPAVKPKAKNK
ncbi:MAG: hypothetical protein JO295_07875 [Verrucomicrobia bacterium]|nr:hypothetical protein [Verrucomicrobiota bacterium]